MKKMNKTSIIFLFLVSLSVIFIRASDLPAENIDKASNKAVSIQIIRSTFIQELSGEKSSRGWSFLILETEWKNIHPKQKVDKDKLEGKSDRTMGVSAFAGKKKKKTEYIEVDVPYMVKKLVDHTYLIADGLAYPMQDITQTVPEGIKLREPFSIAKQGEKRKALFVYCLPEKAENIGLQFFDYQYGHILLPIQGDLKAAHGSGKPSGKMLDQLQANIVEIAAHAVNYQKIYKDHEAPKDWQYAVVYISGKSLSGRTVKDIVQIEPTEYTWVITKEGYFYYAAGGTTTKKGMIRFTPEIFQHQELTFLVPSSSQVAQLGIRLRNDVFQLNLTGTKSKGIPKAYTTHCDGDAMEVMLFGAREEEGKTIINLGIQSLAASGIEIQRQAQFKLVVDEEKIAIDDSFTNELFHRPPTPFIVPPKTFIRFELAFKIKGTPMKFYFRGYRSEATLSLPEKK